MSYVKDMVEREKQNTKEIEEILKNEKIKRMEVRPFCYNESNLVYRLKGSKALVLSFDVKSDNKEFIESLAKDNVLTCMKVTTWSSLLINVMDFLKPHISFVKSITPDSDEFKVTFKSCLKNILETTNFRMNTNSPRGLFKKSEETELIHSSVYMNNKNHFVPVITDEEGTQWGFCAVFTGEIIRMLEALLDTLYTLMVEYYPNKVKLDELPQLIITISYLDRDDRESFNGKLKAEEIDELSAELDSEIAEAVDDKQKYLLSADIIKVQGKLLQITSLVQQVYADLNNIQEKYDLPMIDDLLQKY